MSQEIKFDLAIMGGTCLLPNSEGSFDQCITDLGITQGQIEFIGKIEPNTASQTLDAKGKHVLPGLIDTQVHFRDPGAAQKEDLGSGTLSAIMGGITGILDMPNTAPSTTHPEALKNKVEQASQKAWCHYGFFLGATANNIADLPEWENLPGCCGIKAFLGSSTGDLLLSDNDDLRKILASGRKTIALHSEEESRLVARRTIVEAPDASVHLHPEWRDEKTAIESTEKVLALAKNSQRPVHILHITTATEAKLIRQFKLDHPNKVTMECTPQHLSLFAPDCYDELGSLAQMNPPIRTKPNQDELWNALADGTVDIIGSDHAPHTKEEKARPYPKSPSGMPGVQTSLPIMLDHIHQGRLTLNRLLELMCTKPCQLFGFKNKGAIKTGYDADLTLVDLNKKNVIKAEWIKSRVAWTPFEGREVTGWPFATVIAGNIAMKEGQVIGSPQGKAFDYTIPV